MEAPPVFSKDFHSSCIGAGNRLLPSAGLQQQQQSNFMANRQVPGTNSMNGLPLESANGNCQQNAAFPFAGFSSFVHQQTFKVEECSGSDELVGQAHQPNMETHNHFVVDDNNNAEDEDETEEHHAQLRGEEGTHGKADGINASVEELLSEWKNVHGPGVPSSPAAAAASATVHPLATNCGGGSQIIADCFSNNHSSPAQSHQQQQQQQPLSVIVQHQQQQQPAVSTPTMDEEAGWPVGDSLRGPQSSMLIRDDFIFATSRCASPPSASVPGPDFLYDHPLSAGDSSSILLEDSFLSQPSSLLDAPCSSAGAANFSSTAVFLERSRNGSVGISPCSSSTHISSGGSPDDSLFAQQQQNGANGFLSQGQHNFLASSGHHLLADGLVRQFPLFDGQQQQQQQQFLNEKQFGMPNSQPRAQQHQLAQGRPFFPSYNGRGGPMLLDDEDEEQLMDEEEDEEDGEEQQPLTDMKPLLYKMRSQQQRTAMAVQQQQPIMAGGNRGLQKPFGSSPLDGDGDEEEEEDDFQLSPPPPPLTPPSKCRSKMHDLALKHRLISNQNVRSHGVVQLSAEEKKTLIQEGFPIPQKLPLMREEEEALKIVRRKIKNKLSAQESRRKRKEYMDMLEKRVHAYFADNTALRQKVRQLEAANRCLQSQLQRTQQQQQTGPTTG